MTRPLDDELAEYVMGILPEARRMQLDEQIASSRALRRDVAALREALGALPEQLPKVPPRPAGRNALLDALKSADRYSPFVSDLSRHFDLPAARVRELLRKTDDPSAWADAPIPGIRLIDFDSGPNAIASHAGFVTFPKGLSFPYHRHLGPEVNYILKGSMLADDGRLYIPGEALAMPSGSAHAFSFPNEDTLIAVIHLGFEFIDEPD